MNVYLIDSTCLSLDVVLYKRSIACNIPTLQSPGVLRESNGDIATERGSLSSRAPFTPSTSPDLGALQLRC